MKYESMPRIFLLIILLLFALSCGNEPPNISFPVYNILIYQAKSFNNPSDNIFLSLYFVLYDDDGFDDISTVKITHIKSEYSWTLNPNELTKYDFNNRTYYGYSFLEYDNAKSILLGEYDVEVEDKAGNIVNSDIDVEVEGYDNNLPYNVPEIKYELAVTDKGRELKIVKGDYFSAEIKALNRPDLFGGARKKFREDEKISISSNKTALPQGTSLSVRINKDVNETTVYYLGIYNLKY
jgi:hypothetical protein